ncbi:hypothetical protein HWQ46_21310 [Shewanella sp. D64]|uniref:hypothetical protein n=1 Tax=unclassified Shewanella TaxID=196818 RepID=UPI0022BA243E|nr:MULTISPECIES: hypothetical protein [unclassified Shewanella]MEC4728078.1 hypothetical protein [Shewanella sp. D64]MEC4738164.1 hypothetical protein [Shewanella sp. E94]WBJ96324.1 hypothetical protein HWQ47_04150 [Shewanella sp. MTB7]
MRKSLSLMLLPSSILLCVIHFSAHASNESSTQLSTKEAIDTFQLNTDDILKQARKLNKQHTGHLKSLNQTLAQTESAKAVLRSGLIGEMELDAVEMLSIAEAYLGHYQTFVYSINRDSTCYQPQKIAEFRQTITELQKYVNSIHLLAATPSEEDAFSALIEININQSRVAMTVNLFEVFKLCYITEAIRPLSKKFNELDNQPHYDMLVDESSDDNYPSEPLIKMTSEISSTYQFMADEVVNFNQLSYLYIDDLSQLDNLKLSNGLTVDANLNLRLPAIMSDNNKQAYTANISGRVETSDDIAEINITIKRNPVLTISELKFSDKHIASCIKQSAADSQATLAHQVTLLTCTLPKGSHSQLDDLVHFEQLSMISIKGGTLVSLSPLDALTSLNSLYLNSLTLDKFGDLSSFSGSMNLTDIDTKDWASLALTTPSTLSINQSKDCTRLTPLFTQPNVAVLYKGMDSSEQVNVMEQLDSGVKKVMVLTNCLKE